MMLYCHWIKVKDMKNSIMSSAGSFEKRKPGLDFMLSHLCWFTNSKALSNSNSGTSFHNLIPASLTEEGYVTDLS